MIKSKIPVILFFVSSFLAVPLYSQNSGITESRTELSTIRERLNECRRRKEEIDKEEKNTSAKLHILTEESRIAERLIEVLKKEETSLKEDVTVLQKGIERGKKELEIRKSILAKRLREIYKCGSAHDLELILFSQSFSDVLRRVKYILLIAKQDEKLIDSTKALTQLLVEKKQILTSKMNKESELRKEKENEKERMQHEKKVKEEILHKLRKEKQAKNELEEELKEAEKRVVELIERLERERMKRDPLFEGILFSKYKGKLRWPAKGKVISKFGRKRHPVYWTVTQNNGIDIEAGYGTPVHAVAKGKVAYAERFLGYSKVVLLDHGEGYYTLYAYLSEIVAPTGAIIDEGEIIAYVGDSLDGSLLHFEVRQKGKPEDPLAWLRPE